MNKLFTHRVIPIFNEQRNHIRYAGASKFIMLCTSQWPEYDSLLFFDWGSIINGRAGQCPTFLWLGAVIRTVSWTSTYDKQNRLWRQSDMQHTLPDKLTAEKEEKRWVHCRLCHHLTQKLSQREMLMLHYYKIFRFVSIFIYFRQRLNCSRMF